MGGREDGRTGGWEDRRTGGREDGNSYLEGAAVGVEPTAHLSFGTLVLVAAELQQQTQT